MEKIGVLSKIVVISLFSLITAQIGENTGSQPHPDLSNLESLPGHLKAIGEGRPQHQIDEVNGFPTVKDFFDNYALKVKPLLMKGAGEHSRAFRQWSDDYFLSLDVPADNSVLVESKKKENRSQPATEMNFKDFVRIYNHTDQYMVQHVPDFLSPDVILPGPLQCNVVYQNIIVDTVMWFSSGGTKSVLHTDSVDNINCLFRGNKELVMIDPGLYGDKVDIDHPDGAFSGVDVERVDYTKYPGLAEVEFIMVQMKPGDCLYIPYKWIHHVSSQGSNVAVNVWWNHHQNKRLNLEGCSDTFDPELTLDKVPNQGFDEVTMDVDSIIDHFTDYARRSPLVMDTLIRMIVPGGEEEMEEREAGIGYQIPLKQIIAILDKDGSDSVSKEEMASTTDKEWDLVVEQIQRFEAIMRALEQKWHSMGYEEGHEDEEEQDLEMMPQEGDYDEEEPDALRDEL